MFTRKVPTGVLIAGLALSVVGLTAGTASAAYTPDPDDVTTTAPTTPAPTDFIGVGSDTTQGALASLGRAYNSTAASSTGKLYTYAATAGGSGSTPVGDVQLASKTITRPVGSGPGLATLLSSGEPQIAYARSSRAIGAAEINDPNSLQMFPFAKDSLQMAVQANSSYAPPSLTGTQIAAIYRCDVSARNWSAFGGANLQINPLLPKSGSGTRSFFLGELKAFNNNADLVPGSCVDQTITEHDPAPIGTTAGSVAPFSIAKSKGLTSIKLLGGFAPIRAVYNVLRATDAAKDSFKAIFGPNGFICSAAGKTAIEAAGFSQLLPSNKGGVCGVQTQTAPSNLLTEQADTATAVTVSSASASAARVVARISSSITPSGTVTFFEGATAVASNVPLVSGQATATPAAAPGTHTYRAVFTPAANTAFRGSEGTGTGTVQKGTSKLSESFPSSVKVSFVKGKKKVKPAKGSVSVALVGTSSKASGSVIVKKGSKTLGTGTLAGGTVTLKLKGLKLGANKLTATWAGDANATGGSVSFAIKAKLPKKKK